jgi:two-component system sensor histidine kinase/response regulator
MASRTKQFRLPRGWIPDVLRWNTSIWTISSLFNEKFDLAFMDVQMPEMDGLAATEAIRQREKSSDTHLPIFAVTDHAMKGDRERCLQAGIG